MKSPKSKGDLIETVVLQIRQDVHCGEYEALTIMLEFLPVENLIDYLPEGDWKKFKHLRDASTT
jgi:hypothetical protein